MVCIDLVYFNAGGGHRAAALALDGAIRERQLAREVRLVNLADVLDPQSTFEKIVGIKAEDLYNKRLASGWTIGLSQELKLLHGAIRLAHEAMRRRLGAHWRRTRPDVVVSLIPNFNRALHDGLASACPEVPFVTVMTDMADHPPHFWIEPGIRQHLVCGTPKALAQARAAGCDESLLHLVSGMMLRPEFHRPLTSDRGIERTKLGLPADGQIGLVLFGGAGARVMESIAERLPRMPLIVMCGHNADLARRIAARKCAAPRAIIGFTTEVQRYMGLADFFIGKPGPGSLSEAVQCGLPVITTRNAFTLPQERYNTDWVLENRLGLVLKDFRSIGPAVEQLAASMPAFRAAVAGMRNRALYDVVDLIARLLVQPDAGQHSSSCEPTRPAVMDLTA